MVIIAAVTLLLFGADPSAAGAPAGVVAEQPPVSPCRLLLVEAKSGAENFLVCTQVSIRLEPGRTYEMAWNPALQQVAVVGRGAKDDQALLVSNGASSETIVEDLTVELVKAAQDRAAELGISAIRVKDLSKFASTGAMNLATLDPPNTAEPLGKDLPVIIQTGSETASRIGVAGQ